MLLNIIEIDDILVNREILETKFTCDLSKCKGACCTLESDFGAPITQEEIVAIQENLEGIKEYLPEESRRIIEKEGFFEVKSGEILIRSIERRDCVFVYYESDVAKCAIEKAYREGKSKFLKPLSCHLFPIRVSKFGGDVLRFEKYDECAPAFEHGKETNLSVAEFLREPLIRAYGEDWYNKLIQRGE